jgi:hypothetical protein
MKSITIKVSTTNSSSRSRKAEWYLGWMLAELKSFGFECAFVCHAGAILEHDFPGAVEDITSVLSRFDVPITEIVGSGGGETKGTQRMRKAFAKRRLTENLVDAA